MTTQTTLSLYPPRTDERLLWDLLLANVGYQALLVAHDLKLFSLLGEQPRTLEEVCDALHIVPRPAQALLATCVAHGLVQLQEGRYTLAPAAEDYLLESSPVYFGGFLDLLIATDYLFSFESMKKAVLTNSSQVYGGEALFKSHEEQNERARAFTYGMHGHSMGAAQAWPHAIDLSGHHVMLDVGGGSGAHAISAVSRWPSLEAIVFDLPPVCQVAEEVAARYGVQARISTQAGDIWTDSFPAADLHFYADIFHDWPPEKGRFLAEKSFASLPSGGRIVIHEMLYNAQKSGPFSAAAYSDAMLLWTEGQQYSGDELTAMLSQVGFRENEVKPTFGYWSIVIGRKG